MINTIKTISAGARGWWREFRALPRESKHLFIAVGVGVVLAYFVVSTMSWKSGQIDGQQEIISALANIAPAVESIRAACREEWDAKNWESGCALFFSLHERGDR